MFGSIRLVMVGLLITGIAGAGLYVMKLRSDNAILTDNYLPTQLGDRFSANARGPSIASGLCLRRVSCSKTSI